MPKGIRIRKLTLLGSYGSDRRYEVDFTHDGAWKPLSIIAGASQTGKTSALEYVLYCLGASHFPDHQEMRDNVAAAQLEIELAGSRVLIERTTSGSASKFASIWLGDREGDSRAAERRKTIDPPSDPDNLSQFLLESFGLAGIKLPMSESKVDTTLHTLSIRDAMRLFHLPNSRLDNKNLLFEDGNSVVAQKFQQSIDLTFGVADSAVADIAARLRKAEEAVRESENALSAIKSIVEEEYPEGPAGTEILLGEAEAQVAELRMSIQRLDSDVGQRNEAVGQLQAQMEQARAKLGDWSIKVRDRQSLLDRLDALRLDYVDDLRKLTFLQEAEKLFDPFHVTRCPACMSSLEKEISPVDTNCGLCGQQIDRHSESASPESTETIKREGRAVSVRLDALVEYLGRLRDEQSVFEMHREQAEAGLAAAAAAVEHATELPVPFLAARDRLGVELSAANALLERHRLGARLWARVDEVREQLTHRLGVASAIRRERTELSSRPDRSAVVRQLSDRFGEILADIGYPKLQSPSLDTKLQPHVRGAHYTSASSGGLTLISLAWYLALWEVAYERDGNSPGLLLIDSPQKNLGQRVESTDADFADTKLVDAFYEHIAEWLEGEGRGAQVIIVDNTPPSHVADEVVIRFSGRAEEYPFGLVWDATT